MESLLKLTGLIKHSALLAAFVSTQEFNAMRLTLSVSPDNSLTVVALGSHMGVVFWSAEYDADTPLRTVAEAYKLAVLKYSLVVPQ